VRSRGPNIEEDPKQVVREHLRRAICGGELEAYEELCDPEIVFTSPYAAGPLRGLEAFRETFLAMRRAFPDLRIVEDMVIAEGDLVAARWVASGNHTGSAFAGLPAASGRRFEITAMSFYRVRASRIVEGRVNDDTLGFAAQLGLVPAPERA
jgi:steroid delta-isomerase-like uncharacterized protein